MAWDEAAAQEAVAEFTRALEALIQAHSAAELAALMKLQDLWQAAYMTSGHKRLARVFLKATIE